MNEYLDDAIRTIAKGDTRLAETFLRRPGGRRYLEHLSIMLLHTLVPYSQEKEDMYHGFVQVLDHMDSRIQRQQEGDDILEAALYSSEE